MTTVLCQATRCPTEGYVIYSDNIMLKKIFGFNPKETSVRTEVLAGLTTFLTMSYILAVNPSMFGVLEGMPVGAAFPHRHLTLRW